MAEADETPTQERLTALTNEANLKYSLKQYEDAAELYSRATEMQGELRGDEMAPENAELLYLYGRCLYKVAQAKSDVLGGQVAAEKKKEKPASSKAPPSPDRKLAEDVLETVVEEKEGTAKLEEQSANQPFFQLVDAEWSDDEEDDADAHAEEAIEDEDDFATAYEILDLARVLLERQLNALEISSAEISGKGKGKAGARSPSPSVQHAKERLADTHDLQGEISLENERFADSIDDFRSAVVLKDELFPRTSSEVAEAHYKLSLALEFESMTAIRLAQAKEGEPKAAEEAQVDEKLREEAAKEMEIAVESCKLRLEEEEKRLTGLEGEEASKLQKEIVDMKDITEQMEQRLIDLRGPVVTVNGPAGIAEEDPMAGLLGQILGESKGDAKARIEEATKNANDLSGLVRKKKSKPAVVETAGGAVSSTAATASTTNGKRKMGDDIDEGDVKRAKTEERATP